METLTPALLVARQRDTLSLSLMTPEVEALSPRLNAFNGKRISAKVLSVTACNRIAPRLAVLALAFSFHQKTNLWFAREMPVADF